MIELFLSMMNKGARCLLALFIGSVMFLNTVFILPFILLLAFIKLLPLLGVQKKCQLGLNGLSDYWVMVNNQIARVLTNIEIEEALDNKFSTQDSYVVLSNHQSWFDIIVLQFCLYRKVPALKFFLKESLRWVPVLGLCWWALDFPFMKRYSKAYLAKHPEKKGQDLDATKKACEKFKITPVSIMNYPEGTRFSKEKHQAQKNAFKSLLTPKAGGLAYVLPVLGKRIKGLIDVTVVYPKQQNTFWHFLCGRVTKVKVHVRMIEIPTVFYTMDYANDKVMRAQFQAWLNEKWQEKDDLINQLAF